MQNAPLFSVEAYFLILGGYQVISLAAFLFLAKSNRVGNALKEEIIEKEREIDGEKLSNAHYFAFLAITLVVSAIQSGILPSVRSGKWYMSRLIHYFSRLPFFQSTFPSILTYVCLPFSPLVYHLAVTLGAIASPIACSLPLFNVNLKS